VTRISRQAYAEMFGPTTGDRVRLADTDLWIEVEILVQPDLRMKTEGDGRLVHQPFE